MWLDGRLPGAHGSGRMKTHCVMALLALLGLACGPEYVVEDHTRPKTIYVVTSTAPPMSESVPCSDCWRYPEETVELCNLRCNPDR